MLATLVVNGLCSFQALREEIVHCSMASSISIQKEERSFILCCVNMDGFKHIKVSEYMMYYSFSSKVEVRYIQRHSLKLVRNLLRFMNFEELSLSFFFLLNKDPFFFINLLWQF